MIATIVNALTIIIGSMIGILFRKKISKNFEQSIMVAAGLITIFIGIKMALQSQHLLIFALSLVFGNLVGTWLKLEEAILKLGELLNKRFAPKETTGSFATAFLNASVLYCSGAMAIIGSFNAGTKGDYALLFTKSLLDGAISIFFASALGIGVAFSALPVLVYQGGLTLLSIWLGPLVSPQLLDEFGAVGGAMVLVIGINLLNLRQIKTANLLPALVFVVLLWGIFKNIPGV